MRKISGCKSTKPIITPSNSTSTGGLSSGVWTCFPQEKVLIGSWCWTKKSGATRRGDDHEPRLCDDQWSDIALCYGWSGRGARIGGVAQLGSCCGGQADAVRTRVSGILVHLEV